MVPLRSRFGYGPAIPVGFSERKIEMQKNPSTVLVYGATGAQGSAVVRAALGADMKVRLLLRDGTAHRFGAGVEVAPGDLGDPVRLRKAHDGVDAVALTLPLSPDREMLVRFGRNAIDAARAASVKLLVWNGTGPMASDRIGSAMLDARQDLDAYLRASGVPFITLSPTLYCGNLAAPWSAPAIVRQGVLAYPLPAGLRVSWISWEDVAAFAVAALQRPDLAGRSFAIGGPEALSGTELAAILSPVVGRLVTYVEVPLPDFAAGLNAAFGAPMGGELAAYYAWVQRQPKSPLAVDPTPAIEALSVRPTSFAEWARAQDWMGLAAESRAA
jgi:NAD(P)H dehydrogenase (quinone)